MTEQGWWIFIESRAMIEARLAEAERDRLARQATMPTRPIRGRLASALRAAAERLDGEVGSAAERRLAHAR